MMTFHSSWKKILAFVFRAAETMLRGTEFYACDGRTGGAEGQLLLQNLDGGIFAEAKDL